VAIGDEDCLYLNVWTPISATPGAGLPVMVFLHGGANVQGATSVERLGIQYLDGRNLAERGNVIVVSMEYRLGSLGFLVHPGLDAESVHGGSGNYGLLDQIKALEWVQHNISSFGGDPDTVLLFGQSAGAMDTCMLLTSPLGGGLFARAMMESGGCDAPDATVSAADGLIFAEAAGCGGVADPVVCLRALSTTTLVTAVDTDPFSTSENAMTFGPNVDGYVLPGPPVNLLALGDHHQVPFIIGSNADEALVFAPTMPTFLYIITVHALLDPIRDGAGDEALALYPVGTGPGEYPDAQQAFGALLTDWQFTCPARRVAHLVAPSQTYPVYRYFFTQVLTSETYESLGSFHALELFYAFQHISDIPDYTPTASDLSLEGAMSGYWTRFAGTGDPNGAGAESWPIYEPDPDPYLELGESISSGAGVRTEKCDFWDTMLLPQWALRTNADPGLVMPSDILTYTLTLVNSGGDAGGVVVTTTMDKDATFVWASDMGTHDRGVVVWDVGDLSASQRVTRTLVVMVRESPRDDLLTNTSQVTSTQGVSGSEIIETPIVAYRGMIYLPVILR
jgi:para-nitrobenzyl esterase